MGKYLGKNMTALKQQNRSAILRAIRRENGATRIMLSKVTGLTKGGLTPLVEEMLQLGLIKETSSEKTKSGRRPVKLEACPSCCCTVAVDWTRTHMRAAIVDFAGAIQATVSRPVPAKMTNAEALHILTDLIAETMAGKPLPIGIAVVAPGPLNHAAGTILNPPNFGEIHDLSVVAELEQRFSLPVFLDNNANAHALAEKDYGYGLLHDSFLHLVVDEGIGGGMVMAGKLYRGAMGYGSELGHMTIEHEGLPCPCGNRGCAEQYASIPALLAAAKQPDLAAMLQCIREGETACLAAMALEAGYLSSLLVSAINLFAPEAIVLGSEIAKAEDAIADAIKKELAQRCFYPAAKDLPVYFSKVEHPSLRGGAALVFDAFLDGALGDYEQVLLNKISQGFI